MAPSRRILFLVGDFAEDYEVMVPFQTLQALGFSTDAVCPGKKEGDISRTAVHDFEGDQDYLLKSVLCPWLGAFHKQTYSEKPGHNFVLNATFSDVSWDEYDALVIPGGRAPEYLSVDESVIKLVQGFNAALKPIAAICHGPLILAAAGVLKGKKCTAYPACKPALVAAGAIWEEPDPISACFMDECLVTGAGWLGHPEFIGLLLMAMGARVQGSDKRVLLLAGGKRLTAYPAVKPAIVLAGAEWLEPEPITKCFKDGNLISGAAWPAHPEFLALIMDALGTTVST
eukprot:SM000008S22223  [mRNA]  locus=s8:558437:560739:+ [translate_table: standard]